MARLASFQRLGLLVVVVVVDFFVLVVPFCWLVADCFLSFCLVVVVADCFFSVKSFGRGSFSSGDAITNFVSGMMLWLIRIVAASLGLVGRCCWRLVGGGWIVASAGRSVAVLWILCTAGCSAAGRLGRVQSVASTIRVVAASSFSSTIVVLVLLFGRTTALDLSGDDVEEENVVVET